jgi:hypothetical protein
MRRVFVSFALLCFFPAIAVPQAQAGWTFGKFGQTLTNLSFQVAPSSPEDKAISSISRSLDKIRTAYLAKYGDNADTEALIAGNLAPEYSQSMVDDIATLNQLPPNLTARLTALQEVRDDLAIKAQIIAQASDLTAGVFPSIVQLNLTVTLSAGSQVDPAAVSIRANPHHFGTKPPPVYILSSGIDAQTGRLPPGRFWVWVEVKGQVIQSQERDFGLSGATSAEVKFTL